jgi:large subunit ribosomal protein L20
MARVKGARNRTTRKKKLFGKSKGFFQSRKNRLRMAHQAVMKAEAYRYVGRKQKKRQFRRLWIVRINAALGPHELKYSRFIHGLNKAGIEIDRKNLADLALHEPAAFTVVVDQAKAALAA